MSPYRPNSTAPVSVSLGTWSATGRPGRSVVATFDPRLFDWLVERAAARSNLRYEQALGNPPLRIQLT